MTTTIGYVRVSSEEQAEEGYSLAAQERAIRLYTELHGLTLLKIYIDDGYSGTKDERPAFKQLLADAEAKQFQVVIVHKFDRWARNTVLLLSTIKAMTDRGQSFVSISEQIDCSTAAGKMMLTIIASTAQFHSDNLSTEVKKGIREKVQQGFWHGPYPTGYSKGPDGVMVPNDMADAIRWAYKIYASGMHSYIDTAKELNRRGLRIINPQRPEPRMFDKWNLEVILKNPVYRGFVKFEGQLYPGRHQPIIDEETWNTVQAIIAKHAAKHGRMSMRASRTGGGVMTEVIYCEHCSLPMYYNPSTSKNTKTYGYYRCSGVEKLTCTTGGVRSKTVDDQICAILKRLVLPADLRAEVIARAASLIGINQPERSPEQITLAQQLQVLEHARSCGLIVGEEYTVRRRELEQRMQALANAEQVGPTLKELHEKAALLEDMVGLIDASAIPERRGIIRSIFDRIWVTAHTVCAIMPNGLYLPLASAMAEVCGLGGPGGDRTHDTRLKRPLLYH